MVFLYAPTPIKALVELLCLGNGTMKEQTIGVRCKDGAGCGYVTVTWSLQKPSFNLS